MNISPASSFQPLQGIQGLQGLQGAQGGEAILPKDLTEKVLSGGTPSNFSNFGEALASKITEQSAAIAGTAATGAAQPSTYKGMILQMVQNTQQAQSQAGQAVQKLVQGDGSLHSAMIAMEEASVSFQLLVEMRNKLVESVQELMRMQV